MQAVTERHATSRTTRRPDAPCFPKRRDVRRCRLSLRDVDEWDHNHDHERLRLRLETLNLIARQRLAGHVISGCEVTHNPIDTHVAKLRERVDEFAQLIEAHSEAPHSCVHLDVNISHYSGI